MLTNNFFYSRVKSYKFRSNAGNTSYQISSAILSTVRGFVWSQM